MAEHSAVNRRVVGSSPTCGAKLDEGRRNRHQRPFVFAAKPRNSAMRFLADSGFELAAKRQKDHQRFPLPKS